MSEKSERKRGAADTSDGPTSKRGMTDEAVSILTRTGGAYIPPARLRMLQAQVTDKSSQAYQRIAWEALKKSIHGLINKVNAGNITLIVKQLFGENLIRGRGLLARSIMVAQAASPTFTHVYAALVAIVNARFPAIGELICKRVIMDFRKSFTRNNKERCLSSSKFIGHLFNQHVLHEILPLEVSALLLHQPTNDSVEVVIGFLKEVGMKLTQVCPRPLNSLFDTLRRILNEATLDKRVQYMIEVMFQVRRDGFKDNPAVPTELDLIEEDDQMTHLLTLDEEFSLEDDVNVFKFDEAYEENENKYNAIRKELLGEDSGDDDGDSDSESGESGSDSEEEKTEEEMKIVDNTETNLVRLRRTIYLVIQSSLGVDEAAHKLVKINLKPGQEYELCNMIMDCCAQLRTYEKFYGLLAERFCRLQRKYVEEFEKIFAEQYNTIHRLETVKLRNVAKFFAELLYTDAISWGCLQVIRLNEDDSTSSGRIFIKILFLELSEFMGIVKLNERLRDPTLQCFFAGLLPRDNPRDTRFSINFFTAIGLGGLTVDLREFLEKIPAKVKKQSDTESSDSESSSESNSSSSSSSSDDTRKKKKVLKKSKAKSHRKSKVEEQQSEERYLDEAQKRLDMYRNVSSNSKSRNQRSEERPSGSSRDRNDKYDQHRTKDREEMYGKWDKNDSGRRENVDADSDNRRMRRSSRDKDVQNQHSGSEENEECEDDRREGSEDFTDEEQLSTRIRSMIVNMKSTSKSRSSPSTNGKRQSPSEMSPPRSRREERSPPRKHREEMSPSRKHGEEISPPRRSRREEMPPRKHRAERSPPARSLRQEMSPQQRLRREEMSPPGSGRKEMSPPRSRREEMSPPRKHRQEMSPPPRSRREEMSPPRSRREEMSPPRSRREEMSPPRRSRREEMSPSRSRHEEMSQSRKHRRKGRESS